NPVAALVERPEDREPAAAALRRVLVDVPDPTTERVDTIQRYVPPVADQAARIARFKKLQKPLSKLPKDRIPERARPLVEGWIEHGLAPITADTVPEPLKQGFTEVDGRTDETVLVYPSLKVDYNDGANVIRFADALKTAALPAGAVAGGSFLFMAEIIRMVRDEAPRVIVVVCLLVALVLLPIFLRKPSRIPLVVGTVALVALGAELVMFAFGVRLNMLNFAAIPITIGVGSDYAVNLFGAMDAFDLDAPRATAKMGGAILLCSLTTVVGYTSLLVAQSGALRTFGQACVLGEIMAVTMVLVLLPVMLRRARAPRPAPRAAESRSDDG
ncbi:MAG TPA: MMPL family transporter, partial [Minicystis sp.]|nr:MMPL family transporter [Minicystis sp.]